MKAIEFETFSKNRIIEIPSEYEDFDNTKLKVIIMREESNSNKVAEEEVKAFLKLQELVGRRKIKIDKNINIDELANEVNKDDLF